MKNHAIRKLMSLTIIGALSTLSAPLFADTLYDCSLVINEPKDAIDNLKLKSDKPLSTDDAHTAMDNLKAYCCQQEILTEGCESAKENKDNPESPYAFDQLVSKGFFKLDNKVEGSEDSKAKEWKDAVKERTDVGTGKLPINIQTKFVEIWEPAKWRGVKVDNDSCEISDYDSLPLSARYTAVCVQSTCIARKFFLVSSDLDSRYNQKSCEDLSRKRIDEEMTYIQLLMARKANTFMKDTWKTYTQSYMLETRRGILVDKFSHFNEIFSAVNGKIQAGTKECSVQGNQLGAAGGTPGGFGGIGGGEGGGGDMSNLGLGNALGGDGDSEDGEGGGGLGKMGGLNKLKSLLKGGKALGGGLGSVTSKLGGLGKLKGLLQGVGGDGEDGGDDEGGGLGGGLGGLFGGMGGGGGGGLGGLGSLLQGLD